MDNHDKNDGSKNIIWTMWVIVPLLLLLDFLFLGGSRLTSSGYFWSILIGVFVVAHIWMMSKRHGGHKDEDNKPKTGGCCS